MVEKEDLRRFRDCEWDTSYDYQRLQLEKFKICVLKYLDSTLSKFLAMSPRAEVSNYMHWESDLIALRIVQEVYGVEHDIETVEYPSNWWEAVRDRWMPRLLRKWFPIHYTKVTIHARELYPQIDSHGRPQFTLPLFSRTRFGLDDGEERWWIEE